MKIKNILASTILATASVVAFSVPTYAVDCPTGTVRGNKGLSANTIAECNIEEDNSLMPTIVNIINFIVGVLGVAAVLAVILGGAMYITSNADATKLKKAKDTILYGIIGLVVAIMAWAIVNFVLNGISGNSSGGGDSGGQETLIEN